MTAIIIKTGFQKVTHNIVFDLQKEKNGLQLSRDGHVRDLTEFRVVGKEISIEAEVVRTVSVSANRYKIVLKINNDRVITTTSCTCVSNKSGKCKHLFAVIHKINNYESLTKTDRSQEWGKPSAATFSKEKYSKGNNFCAMFTPSADPPAVKSYKPTVSQLKSLSPLKLMMLASMESSTKYKKKLVMKELLDRFEMKRREHDCEACLYFLFIFNELHEVYSTEFAISKELQEFFTQKFEMSQDEIKSLCCDTIIQSKNDKWFLVRFMRISASKNAHSIKSRVTKSIDSLVFEMFNPKKVDTKATRYGIKHEEDAKKVYKQLVKCDKVVEVGVIVKAKQPWLCASLDGVVVEDNCPIRALEIKCPYLCEKKAVIDYEEKTSAVNYLEIINDQVFFKKSDIYYTQCQVQMYVSGLTECDLFVYSPVPDGSCCVKVYRDEVFLKNVIIECEKFYYKEFLPKLFDHVKLGESRAGTVKSVLEKRCFNGIDISNQKNIGKKLPKLI